MVGDFSGTATRTKTSRPCSWPNGWKVPLRERVLMVCWVVVMVVDVVLQLGRGVEGRRKWRRDGRFGAMKEWWCEIRVNGIIETVRGRWGRLW